MRFFGLLFAVLFSISAHAQRVVEADVTEGVSAYRNYVKNPSARRNALGVTVSSATATRDTDSGDAIDGGASWLCDASADTGYCEWTLNTIQRPDDTGNCKASLWYKGDASLYRLQILDGSSNLLHETLNLMNASEYTEEMLNYPCGSSRKVRLTQRTAGTAPAVNVGRVYYGKADNIGTVAQAQVVSRISRITSAQTVSSTSSTVVQFNSVDFNNEGTADVSTNYRWTAASSGRYFLHANIGFNGATLTTGERYLFQIRKNGSLACNGNISASGAASVHYGNVSCVQDMVAGDYVDVVVTSAADTSYEVWYANATTYLEVTKFPDPSQAVSTAMSVPFGTARSAATANCAWESTSGTMDVFAADTDCPTISATGSLLAPATKIPGFQVSSVPPGTYEVTAFGNFLATASSSAATACAWEIYDGTTSAGVQRISESENLGSATNMVMNGVFTYTSTQGARTYQVRTRRDAGNGVCAINSAVSELTFVFKPISQSLPVPLYVGNTSQPTITRLTSGSGTYNTPPNTKWLRIRMVGGGGGGSGSGEAATAGSGGAGGNTTFGTSLITANGGGGAVFAGTPSPGGSVTINSPAISILAATGGTGQGGINKPAIAGEWPGGVGGASCFGGAGASSYGGYSPDVGKTNSGSGGGGAGIGTGSNLISGGGGGSGGCAEAIIPAGSVAASYAYAVGAGGTAGGAGTSGFAGGAGGSGLIIVEAHPH